MNMNNDIRREVIKALAYGKTREEIKRCMEVSDILIDSISEGEIEAKRRELKGKGYIR